MGSILLLVLPTTARMWDSQGRDAGVLDITFVNHGHFSPSGGRLLMASSSGQSKLFDVSTAKLIKELTYANRPIVGAQYSSDGSRSPACRYLWNAYFHRRRRCDCHSAHI